MTHRFSKTALRADIDSKTDGKVNSTVSQDSTFLVSIEQEFRVG